MNERIVKNGERVYIVGDLVASAPNYRLFLCNEKGREGNCLLQIGIDIANNGELDRMAYMLRELKRASDELEEEYRLLRPGKELNYDLGFPHVLDSFICPEHGNRRVNILTFRCVDDVRNIVPLRNLTEKDRLRVDPRTSAWMMGKILKVLTLAQDEGISIDLPNNSILFEPDFHYMMVFDWTLARMQHDPAKIGQPISRDAISQAAKAIIIALGGDPVTGELPDDEEEKFELYVDEHTKGLENPTDAQKKAYRDEAFRSYQQMLFRLAQGRENDAETAHKQFYALIDTFWRREFYPFTTKPL